MSAADRASQKEIDRPGGSPLSAGELAHEFNADSQGVQIGSRVTPEAEDAPAGPSGVPLLHGLRNAVQACRAGVEPGQVSLELPSQGAGP